MKAKSSLFWDVTQCRLVVGYRRFGTTYWSHLQVSMNPKRRSLDPSGWDTYLSRNVCDNQSTLSNMPEERRSHLHRGGSLKSRKMGVAWEKVCASQTGRTERRI